MASGAEVNQHAHDLLDRLGPGQLAAVVHLLETMVSREEDGDTLSEAERQAVAEADAWRGAMNRFRMRKCSRS